MRIGVVFPQIELATIPPHSRSTSRPPKDWGIPICWPMTMCSARDTTNRPGWSGSYALNDPFHEVVRLLRLSAGLTQRMELVTGVLILPQRQTALVAKQAAEIDVLSSGRLRLGVGVGWNEVEYEGLGEDLQQPGRAHARSRSQLLRALWTQPVDQSSTGNGSR